MSRSDAERIADALGHLDVLHRHVLRHDLSDETVVDAVSLRLAAAIEALSGGDPATGPRVFGQAWHEMWSVRNRIAHGYAYVDRDIITATVEDDLPTVEDALRRELIRLRGS